MSLPLDEYKVRVEKDLLPAAGKESMGVISKAVPSSTKMGMGILFREPIHIYMRGLWGWSHSQACSIQDVCH
jgi:hypothetical protein